MRALGNRVMSPISASMTRAVNSPTPGSVRSTLTRGSPCAGVQFAVEPLDQRRQAVDDRQAVGHDLPRRRWQVQLGQPAASRAGPVAGTAVIAMVGGDRMDPVTQLGAQPDQLIRCRSSARS